MEGGGGGVIRNMRVDVMQNNAMLRCWDAICQDCNWVVSSYKSDLAYKWGLHIYKMPGVFNILRLIFMMWWLWWRVTMLDNDRDKGDKCRLAGLHNEIASQMNISLPAHCALRWDYRDADLLHQNQVDSSAVNDKALIFQQKNPEQPIWQAHIQHRWYNL